VVISVRRYQGGKPVLIDAAGQKNIWDAILILDADPHRLNAGVVERHSEYSSALFGTEHSRADSNLAVSLGSHLFKRIQIGRGLRPVEERATKEGKCQCGNDDVSTSIVYSKMQGCPNRPECSTDHRSPFRVSHDLVPADPLNTEDGIL